MVDSDPIWEEVLSLAARGIYSTSPNPRVGAVLVASDGTVVGRGFHERAGGPHAEVRALAQAGGRARGSTLYVNLEPCAHQGRTPPCSDALVAAGVTRVLASLEDPDPRTSGRGMARLREHGVETAVGGAAEAAARLNEAFLLSAALGRPFVHLKWASSLDGKTAASSRASKWITGAEAREDVLRLREECDAILVGSGTVLADDPRLTRRLGLNRSIHPHRKVVLDGDGLVDAGAGVFSPEEPGEAWLFTCREAADPSLEPFRRRGVRVETRHVGKDGFDLGTVLRRLHELEVRSVLVEGGGETAWTFLAAGLADRVTAYLAPSLIGGSTAPTPLGGEGFPDIARLPRLVGLDVVRLGEDLRVSGRVGLP